jgi:hypothetical protein
MVMNVDWQCEIADAMRWVPAQTDCKDCRFVGERMQWFPGSGLGEWANGRPYYAECSVHCLLTPSDEQ